MSGLTLEQTRADQRERDVAKREEMRAKHPTEHPHLLTITLWQGAMARVTCPGKGKCPLWYDWHDGAGDNPGKCGLEIEFEEIGSEMLEYQVGPPFTPASNPFPIGFTWSGGGEDEPPEIEWWPIFDGVAT